LAQVATTIVINSISIIALFSQIDDTITTNQSAFTWLSIALPFWLNFTERRTTIVLNYITVITLFTTYYQPVTTDYKALTRSTLTIKAYFFDAS
jgi:hypothetical protein